MPTTCQICARAIKAGNGLIAHHGYTRRQGWQTSSCMGARYRPYEVSCDRIAYVIEHIEAYLARQRAALAAWIASPPDTLTYQRRDACGSPRGAAYTFDRPAGFDPHGRYNFGRQLSYEHQHADRLHAHQRNIREAEASLVELRQRLDQWRAP